ncbi:hypothetical protein FGG08_007367 [Glutinoglossum americanum]|uniref:Uncharacterized protein n=1 Tax=Glutinoglossum americanum TaxID=1670608 RepID=A0A9P8HWG7_9PEZI|nr:hypothetical protein FGG08_007367 [Glutinoglossum americanum]
MPPKKKLQLPTRAPSTIPQDDQPMADATPVAETPATTPAVPALQADPWTDEQEISLFKGVVNWKPAGMHKHFRMIAIAQQLRHHGVTGPDDRHTRIPGIWQKLRTLYNLEAIDARVNGPRSELRF